MDTVKLAAKEKISELKGIIDTFKDECKDLAEEIEENSVAALEDFVNGDIELEDLQEVAKSYKLAIDSRLAAGSLNVKTETQDKILDVLNIFLVAAKIVL